MNPESNVNLIN